MIKKYIYKIGWQFLRVYWFLFRPYRSGAKIILTNGGQVLLVMHTYGSGKWSLPGGGMEKGEDPESTIKREVAEELEITLANPKYLGNFVSRSDYKHDKIFVFTQKIARDLQFKLQLAEIEEAKWFNLHNLPELSPTTKSAFNIYRQST